MFFECCFHFVSVFIITVGMCNELVLLLCMRGVRSVVISMSLSVCPHISKTTCLNFTKLLYMYMLSVAVAWSSSDDSAIR